MSLSEGDVARPGRANMLLIRRYDVQAISFGVSPRAFHEEGPGHPALPLEEACVTARDARQRMEDESTELGNAAGCGQISYARSGP